VVIPVIFRIEFQNETAVMNIKPKVSEAPPQNKWTNLCWNGLS